MRKIFLVLLLLISANLNAQQKEVLFDFNFINMNLKQILQSIEDESPFYFYYQDTWLKEFKLQSKSYTQKTIEFVLNDIFESSNINFYIALDEKVFLTKNSIIYSELPEFFFEQSKGLKSKEKENVAVIFGETEKKRQHNKIIIGKADKISIAKTKLNILAEILSLQSGLPLTNVKLTIKGKGETFTTNDKGFANFNLRAGRYTVAFSSTSIENTERELIIYNDGNFKLEVNENIEQLREVVIDAEARSVLNEAITKTTIDVEDSKNIPLVLGERDILKVSTLLPGITTTGEGAVGFNVRGGKTDQNLVLLDEAVIYNPQHFFGLFSALNPYAVGDVSIYKGGIPSRYGGRLSSVFDLKTRDATTEKFSGEASVGPVTGNVLIETPIVKGKSGVLVGARGAYADWILKNLDNESLKNSNASFFDVIAKYNHKISDNSEVEGAAYWSRDNFNVTNDSIYGYSNKLVSLKWQQRINAKHKALLAISNSDYDFDITYDGPVNNDSSFNYSVNESNLKIQFNYSHSKNIKFEYGIASKLYLINPGEITALNSGSIIEPLTLNREKGLESAFYLSSNVNLTEKINIDVGLRYSMFNALGSSSQSIYDTSLPKKESTVTTTEVFGNNEVFQTYMNPEFRFSSRYSFNEDLSLKLSYGRTVQYVHTLSNNTTASPIDTWKLSDKNIRPQNSDQFSVGVFKNLNNDLYQFSLEGYYKTSENVVDFKTGAQVFLNENIETQILQGEGKAYGLEFLLKKQKGKLNGWLGYTYSRSLIKFDSEFDEEEINDGEFFSSNYDRPHDISLVANYKFTKRYSVSSNFTYQTGRPITFPVGTFNFNNSEFTVYSDRNKFRIPDYYRLDIGFNIEGNHKLKKTGHSFWTISVYNVLGRNNPFSVFFVTEDGDVKAYQSSIFAVPIPSITYNFKF